MRLLIHKGVDLCIDVLAIAARVLLLVVVVAVTLSAVAGCQVVAAPAVSVIECNEVQESIPGRGGFSPLRPVCSLSDKPWQCLGHKVDPRKLSPWR